MFDLYVSETCPYCHKVIDFLEKENIKYNKKLISNEDNLCMLMKLGGERQVPFLVDRDNNISMYESDDIIQYIKSKV